MFILIRAILWVLIVLIWGDWRNWTKYQSSILYVILGDFLYNFLCYRYSMWEYAPNRVFPTHTATALFYALTIHPCVMILFLGHYPHGWRRQSVWISAWVLLYAVIEWIEWRIGIIVYNHGWNFWWSIALMAAVLPLTRLHQLKPLWTYGISAVIAGFLVHFFHVPFAK